MLGRRVSVLLGDALRLLLSQLLPVLRVKLLLLGVSLAQEVLQILKVRA